MLDALPFPDQPGAGDRQAIWRGSWSVRLACRRTALPAPAAARPSPSSARRRPVPGCGRRGGFPGSAGCRAAARCRTARAIWPSGPAPARPLGRPTGPERGPSCGNLGRIGSHHRSGRARSEANFLRSQRRIRWTSGEERMRPAARRTPISAIRPLGSGSIECPQLIRESIPTGWHLMNSPERKEQSNRSPEVTVR